MTVRLFSVNLACSMWCLWKYSASLCWASYSMLKLVYHSIGDRKINLSVWHKDGFFQKSKKKIKTQECHYVFINQAKTSNNERIPVCTILCCQQGTILDDKVTNLWVLMSEEAVEKRKSRPHRSPPPFAGPTAGLAINNSESNAAVLSRGVVKALTSEPSAFQGCRNGLFSLPDGSWTQHIT